MPNRPLEHSADRLPSFESTRREGSMARQAKIGEAEARLSALLEEVEERGSGDLPERRAGAPCESDYPRRRACGAFGDDAPGTDEAEDGDGLRDSLVAPRGARTLMSFVPGSSAAAWTPSGEAAELAGIAPDRIGGGTACSRAANPACRVLPGFPPYTPRHCAVEFVSGITHANGIGSFWPLLKRGHAGVSSCMSVKRLFRHVTESAGRENAGCDAMAGIDRIAAGTDGRQLDWRGLTA